VHADVKRDTRRNARWVIAGGATLFGTLITLIAITHRTIWLDETATIAASTRSWDALQDLIGRIDLVHAAYYVGMHLWFDLVGYSPFTLRFPSAVAIGLAGGLVVLLAERLFSLATATISAIILPLLPVVASAGTSGRSPAFELLLAVLTTVLLVHALDATDSRKPPLLITLWWLLYAVFAYVSVLVFLWAALIVAAHALTVFLRFLFAPKQRWIGLAAAAWTIAILGVAVVPFVRATIPQSRQIGWLQAPTWHSAIENGWRLQFFDFALVTTTRSFVTAVAVVSWLLVLVGVAFALRKRREALVVMLPWLIVPTVALLAASHFYKPVYNARYVTYSAPALAILIAAGIVALLPYAKGIISGLLLIAFLIPAGQVWWSIRYASPKSTDLAAAARELTEARKDEHGPAGLILGKMHRPADQLTIAYPSSVEGLKDLWTKTSAADMNYFFARMHGAVNAANDTKGLRTVWYVGDNPAELDQVSTILRGDGFQEHAPLTYSGAGERNFIIEFTR
jgi:mannosyltransferase